MTFCQITIYQRWSEYNTNVLEYEYDYFEHAWVRVLRKQMYSSTSTITLNMHEYEYSENKCTRVRLLYNILEYEYDYFTM